MAESKWSHSKREEYSWKITNGDIVLQLDFNRYWSSLYGDNYWSIFLVNENYDHAKRWTPYVENPFILYGLNDYKLRKEILKGYDYAVKLSEKLAKTAVEKKGKMIFTEEVKKTLKQ